MRRILHISDIDRRRDEQSDGIGFAVAEDREHFRRWRPAIVRGDGAARFLDAYFRNITAVPWAGLITLDGAEVIGDGLIAQGDTAFVGESLMYPPAAFPYGHSTLRFERQDDAFVTDVPDQETMLEGTTANIVCDGWRIYGHWLVDVLPRLHRAMTSGVAIDRYLLPGPPSEWQIRLLEAVGVDMNRVRFEDLTAVTVRCERMIVPTYDRLNSEIRPAIMRVHDLLRGQALGGATPERTRDLFVSRGEWSGSRRLGNRAAVEAIFASLGFEVVRPEHLSFADQIALFASARSVAGECGSGMHNTVFSAAGTRVLVLQSETNFNFLQSQLGMLRDHEVYYVLGRPAAVDGDDFDVDVQDVRYVAELIRD